MNVKLPQFILKIDKLLKQEGYQSFLVGGAVRDLLMGAPSEKIGDWDLATNAKPQEIIRLFPEYSKYEDKFGTVTLIEKRPDKNLEIEITPFRKEGGYEDFRHPQKVEWAGTIKEDLGRRDFTINAMAIEIKSEIRNKSQIPNPKLPPTEYRSQVVNYDIIDPFEGQKDLESKLIRAVGKPEQRFCEDALRLIRAVRFAAALGFKIEPETRGALQKNVALIKKISAERIQDELIKIIMSPRAEQGIRMLDELGLLALVLPELKSAQKVEQSSPHRYDVYEHSLRALAKAAEYGQSLELRLAALFHDIGKPKTRGYNKTKDKYTFYDHAIAGARITEKILKRLKFPASIIKKVVHLIYHHMFYYDVGVVTESAVRRLLRRIGGREAFQDLMALRIVDRKATPVPKAKPYKLRHLEFMVEKVRQDPLSVGQLAINGNQLMETLNIKPGPRVGLLLEALLAEVLEDPKLNKLAVLKRRAQELNQKTDRQLQKLAQKVTHEKKQRLAQLKQKFWVK
jgi:poly(A) polymerase/tRNA nucleotidyltransferase (CCA-adding enzyme)